MSDDENRRSKESVAYVAFPLKDFEQIANELCEKALNEAKSQLHPLIRSDQLERLDKRYEFVQAFKLALE